MLSSQLLPPAWQPGPSPLQVGSSTPVPPPAGKPLRLSSNSGDACRSSAPTGKVLLVALQRWAPESDSYGSSGTA